MHHQKLSRVLACTLAAACVLAGPALADELVGRVLSVDVEARKLKVKEKDTDKEVEVTVTDETVIESKGKARPLDLEKFKKNVEKSKKGVQATITHEKAVASKIVRKASARKAPEQSSEEPKS